MVFRASIWREWFGSRWFLDEAIVATLSQQLGWSHFIELLPVREPLARDYYAEMCRVERWSVRALRDRIASMLFERTALSRKPEKMIQKEIALLRGQGRLAPDLVFRDPYVLDFLELKDAYQEKDLEASILRELESFILEMGTGFSFVARQKRVIVDGDDFYLDLLFYHRDLRRLVAVELKLDRFRPEHKPQSGNCICAGWKKMSANLERLPPSVSFYAPENRKSRLRCWRWAAAASEWRNISPNCRRVRYLKTSCTRPLNVPVKGTWKAPRLSQAQKEKSMKIQFDAHQAFQIQAVAAITDLFDGQPKGAPEYSVIQAGEIGGMFAGQAQTELGLGNRLLLDDEKLRMNARGIQAANDIETPDEGSPLEAWQIHDPVANKVRACPHFSVEMETGTGKTYVYLRTIFELSRRYGFQKFIIVVPSVAIREGVLKNIDITAEHFRAFTTTFPSSISCTTRKR